MSHTQGMDRILARIAKIKQIETKMVKVVDDGLLAIEAAARANASGPRPEHIDEVTGDLVRQIQSTGAFIQGNTISGEVVSNSDHGMIHETGGVITAKNAPFLVWQDSSGNWYRKKAVTIPARPYMDPAIRQTRDKIVKNAESAIQEIFS
jgi:phage gpG-like protein